MHKPRAHMEPGQYYHVYNRANAYEKLFLCHENYRFFLEKCNKYLAEVATLYAFALIPNHFHLLLRIHEKEQFKTEHDDCNKRVIQVLSNLFNSYTKSYNRYYRRRGTLFSRSVKHILIDTLEYRKICVLYLHHNAIHHDMCEDLDEWPYTSHSLLVDHPDDVNSAEVLSWFGGIDGYLNACAMYRTPSDSIHLWEGEAS